MNRLERIDALLEVDVVGRKLGLGAANRQSRQHAGQGSNECTRAKTDLVLGLTKLFLGVLEGARGKRGDLASQGAACERFVSFAQYISPFFLSFLHLLHLSYRTEMLRKNIGNPLTSSSSGNP